MFDDYIELPDIILTAFLDVLLLKDYVLNSCM